MKSFLSLLFSVMLLTSCSLTLPIGATSNPVGSKVGTSSATCYLGYVCFDGDAGIQAAAKAGGITKISTVDYRQKNTLNILVTHECIVTGN
ncbi:MAG: hypothetical protein CL850_01730 [Crocinitomicaceae bacterium]|nr:hypothetical protein [Crocinitomicaceae bacterium]